MRTLFTYPMLIVLLASVVACGSDSVIVAQAPPAPMQEPIVIPAPTPAPSAPTQEPIATPAPTSDPSAPTQDPIATPVPAPEPSAPTQEPAAAPPPMQEPASDATAFTNLATDQPVDLTRAFWLPEDFENKLVICSWFEFDGSDYIRGDTAPVVIIEHTPLSPSGIGRFSFIEPTSVFGSSTEWSLVNGVYNGFANFAQTPWLEVLERSNGVDDTSAVRFWYFDSSYQECSSLDPENFFRPTGTPSQTDTNDALAVNDNVLMEVPLFISRELAVNTATDAVWQFCDSRIDNVLSQNQTFGIFPTFRGSAVRACVRRCPADAVILADLPGWGFDANAGAECIFDDNPGDSSAVVPVYVENSVQPIEFEESFAFPLYEGDGFWQCAIEARSSNRDTFIVSGSEITFQLTSDGNTREGSNWFFDDRSDRRTLRIQVELADSTPFVYEGYTLIDHNSLTIYKTSLERLSCNKLNPVEDTSLPVIVSSFIQAPSVPANILLNQTTQCRGIESLQRSDSSVSSSGVGFNSFGVGGSSNDIPVVARDFEISPRFLFADIDGNFIYELDLLFLGNFQFDRDTTSDGEVFNRTQSSSSSTMFTTIRFRKVGEQTLAERLDRSASSVQTSRSFSYFVCDSAL